MNLDTPLDVNCPSCRVPAGVPCDWKAWKRAAKTYVYHQPRKNRLRDERRRERTRAESESLREMQADMAARKKAVQAADDARRRQVALEHARTSAVIQAARRAQRAQRVQRARPTYAQQIVRHVPTMHELGIGWAERAQREFARIALFESKERERLFYSTKIDAPEPCWKCGKDRPTHFTPCCA